MEEGDGGFLGVNTYDSAENLQSGEVQAAVNMDFSTQDAVTRGGFVCLPELGRTPIGDYWVPQNAAAANAWSAIAFGNGVFVAVSTSGSGNRVMTSRDGIAWTSRTSAADNQWTSVCYGSGLFVAVSSTGAGNRVMTSPDGVTWTSRTSASDSQWFSVCWGDDLFVAVAIDGSGNTIMTSPDGIVWTGIAPPSYAGWDAITFGGGLFVSVAGAGVANCVMTSPDGVTWTLRAGASTNSWSAVTHGNGLFVAVSVDGVGNRVMTSPDGITWTSRASAADSTWSAIVYGAGKFVVAGKTAGDPPVMTSQDGISWVLRTNPTIYQLTGITFGNNTFVAVANTGANRVMTASNQTVFATGIYSDPDDAGSQWIMLVTPTKVGFFASGRASRTIDYDTGLLVTELSTVVQANNAVYIFRGFDQTPLYWDGSWASVFTLAPTPTPGAGFTIIPSSNQATYYQDRLWVIRDKDVLGASDVLDFTVFDELANEFNLNTGDSNYLVTTYPFGDNALLVFKNRSIIVLQNVQGSLADVTTTEITRQVGAIGINAVVSVGPDVVYMSDRNINLITLTETNNSVQHRSLPLSTKIQSIFKRVNWQAASKVSMGYTDNKLFVALPLDNSTVCNTVCVYNFITDQWFGEWDFADALGIGIQGWAVATYLGVQRMHCITEDGRIFVTGEGQNDISGTIVAEISTSLTTRAYKMDNNNRINRRMFLDLGTNRPEFSVVSYVDGAGESSAILTDQTYSRSQSWIFSDAAYDLTNANDDYNRAGRKDYSSGPNSIQAQSGFLPEMNQEYRYPILTRGKGRLTWFKISNTQGFISINGIGAEARAGDRSSLVQVL
jgi:predicted RecA/RadA family phage recombinase